MLLTYNDVVKFVKDFNCGVFFDDEFLAANPDLKVTLELQMFQTTDEEEVGVVIGEPYEFVAPAVAKIGDVEYKTLEAAVEAADDGDTIVVINDLAVISTVVVDKDVTIDLNGYKLTATYVAADFANANIIDSSEENTGLLVVAEGNVNFAMSNKQLPVKTPDGYRLADTNVRLKIAKNTDGIRVTTGLMGDSDLMIAEPIKAHGLQDVQVQFRIKLEWTGGGDDKITQYFRYKESTHNTAVDNWTSNVRGYDAGGLGMTVTGAEGLSDLSFVGQLVLLDATGREMVVFESDPAYAADLA